jgi:hypothetical protein
MGLNVDMEYVAGLRSLNRPGTTPGMMPKIALTSETDVDAKPVSGTWQVAQA